MAIDFIAIKTDTRLNSKTRSILDQLRAVRDGLRQLNDTFVHLTDGVDGTKVEQQLGLQAGEGVSVYNLVAGAKAAVDVVAVNTLIDRCG